MNCVMFAVTSSASFLFVFVSLKESPSTKADAAYVSFTAKETYASWSTKWQKRSKMKCNSLFILLARQMYILFIWRNFSRILVMRNLVPNWLSSIHNRIFLFFISWVSRLGNSYGKNFLLVDCLKIISLARPCAHMNTKFIGKQEKLVQSNP